MLGQKSSLNKFKKIEIILNIFVDHNDMKLETNYRKKNREGTQSMWRLKQHATKKKWVTEKIKRKSDTLRQMKIEM